MTRHAESLAALLRLRRIALDQARTALAEALVREGQAAAAMATLDAAMARETEAATSLATGDYAVDAFDAWLKRTRPVRDAAEAALQSANDATAEVRAVLAAARAGVEAAEELLARLQAEQAAEVERAAQHALDDATRRRPG